MQSDQRVIPQTTPASARLAGGESAAGEVHGHFKADTQVGKRGFSPHGAVLLLCRKIPVGSLMHGGMGVRMLLSNEPGACIGSGCTPIKMWEGRCDDSTCPRWRWVSDINLD